MKISERTRKKLLIAGVLIAGIWILIGSRRTLIKPFDATSHAAQYAKEFHGYVWTSEVSETSAPDGSARIQDEPNLLYPLGGCRTIWVNPKLGRRRMIARMREIDPGSGTTWGLGWSRDSKAVFLKGSHSGLDCRGISPGPINVIYTIADGVAMQAPPESLETGRTLGANLPPADMRKVQEVREAEKWLNPFIRIHDRSVTVSFHDSGVSKTSTAQVDALGNELSALPKTAWPYGRIVAVSMSGPQSSSMTELQVKVQRDRIRIVLQNFGLAINWWP